MEHIFYYYFFAFFPTETACFWAATCTTAPIIATYVKHTVSPFLHTYSIYSTFHVFN